MRKLIVELLKYYFYLVALFFIGRLGLFVVYHDRFSDVDTNLFMSFFIGLKLDTVIASTFLLIPMILLTLFPKFLSKFVDGFLKFYFGVVFAFVIYMENATYPFFAEYDVRPNYKFVEYLKYPKEVFGMIVSDYWMQLLFAFIMIAVVLRLFYKYNDFRFKEILEVNYLKRVALFLPLLVVLFVGIRGSLDHRPINNADASISSNRVLNEITKNTIYSIGYAVYCDKQFETDITKIYGKMDIDEAFKRVKKRLNITSEGRSLKRYVKTHFATKKPKNLVIFLQESLGYQFVSQKITPNLLKLKKEGIWFDNLYSNGTRSVRGIAGMVAGNFSVPGKGVVKRNKSQSDYFTFSKLLKPLGYETSFIYGGESRFDNMRGWFLGNGFDRVIDDSVMTEYHYKGNWGVCDGEVVSYANRYFKTLHDSNKPFASIIFSTSNHTPFDFPQDKIELIDGVKPKSVENAVKYADYAIGELIELAKKSGYYKDTVFVVVADHNVRTYGDDVVPVNMFHIPAVIVGGGVESKFYDKVSTQPDVLATVLDLVGRDFEYPVMGHSIFSDKKQSLSLMQFNNYYALRVGDKVAVLKDDKSTQTFIYHDSKELKITDKHLKPTKKDVELEKDVLAFVTVLNYLYQNKGYK